MSALAPDEKAPYPLIECGDFVRLKDPHPMRTGVINNQLRPALEGAVEDRAKELEQAGAKSMPGGILAAKDHEAFGDLFQFTHGTVAEVIERASWTQIDGHGPVPHDERREAKRPTLRVSLHLFNPRTGLMYVGGHPTEPGKPEFVDHHISELTLVHKAEDAWGNEYDLDASEVYTEWGINHLGMGEGGDEA